VINQLKLPVVAMVVTAVVVALAAAGCGGLSSGSSDNSSAQSVDLASIEKKISGPSKFRGPNGEKPFVTNNLKFTHSDLQKLHAGHYSVAVDWHDIDASIEAENRGIRDEFNRLGIGIAVQTNANFDAAQQTDDYQAAIAKNPDAIMTLPVDAHAAAKALQPAVARGIPIVLEEAALPGYKQGSDYVSIVALDYTQAAQAAADILGQSLGGKGNLAYLYYDANFFITNEWDKVFKQTIERDWPGIHIVADQGFADTDPAKVADVAGPVIAKHPDINAIYATYQDPLEGVLSALRESGRNDVSVTDVGMDESVALNMAQCGPVVGVGEANFYQEGVLFAQLAAYGILGKKAPPLVIARSIPVTRENLAQAWQQGQGEPLPSSVKEALAKGC
jgi:ribose transport system substrate-binding protein